MTFWAIFVVALAFEHVSSSANFEGSELKNVITKLFNRLSDLEAQNADLNEGIANLTTSIEAMSSNMQTQSADLQANLTTKVSFFFEKLFVLGYVMAKQTSFGKGRSLSSTSLLSFDTFGNW